MDKGREQRWEGLSGEEKRGREGEDRKENIHRGNGGLGKEGSVGEGGKEGGGA